MSDVGSFIADMARRQRKGETFETPGFGLSTGAVIGSYLALPELRGTWPFSSMNEAGSAYDLSGQGRTLTNAGGVVRAVLASGLPYATQGGAYFTRPDEAGLDITGALTFGAWVYFTNNASGQEAIITKSDGSGGATDGFFLARYSDGKIRFYVASGAAIQNTYSSSVLYGASWYHVIVSFTPSSAIRIFINGVVSMETGTVYASINNSPAPLSLFAYGAGLSAMTGRMALPFLCASALPNTLIASLYQNSRGLFGI